MNYKDYIMEHRKIVIEIWEHKLMPVLIYEEVDLSIINQISTLVFNHDMSKLECVEEYAPYSMHHDDPENYTTAEDGYLRAQNHHHKMNPHHWQYWVVLGDTDKDSNSALEMKFEYVIEMLCDWYAKAKHDNKDLIQWYEDNKENMILHPNTRELIEKYIVYLK